MWTSVSKLPTGRHRVLALLAGLALGTSLASFAAPGHTFAIGANDVLLDGKPFQIRCGETHAPRVPPEYWRHRLQMARAMGSASPPHPHLTVIDLGQPETIGGVRYTPRPGNGGGRIQNSRFTFASAERPLRIAREALRRNPALQSKTSEGDGVEFLALTHRDQLIVHLVNSRSDPVNSRLRPGWDSRAPVRALQTTAFADLQTAPAACVRSVAGREGREHLALLPPYSLTTLVQRAR